MHICLCESSWLQRGRGRKRDETETEGFQKEEKEMTQETRVKRRERMKKNVEAQRHDNGKELGEDSGLSACHARRGLEPAQPYAEKTGHSRQEKEKARWTEAILTRWPVFKIKSVCRLSCWKQESNICCPKRCLNSFTQDLSGSVVTCRGTKMLFECLWPIYFRGPLPLGQRS